MIRKSVMILMLLVSIVFGLSSACQKSKESEAQQERAKEKKVAKEEEQKKRIVYFADLIEAKQYRVTKKYEQELSKNRGLLINDIDYHGKPKSIFHHPLQAGDNNITFPDIEIRSNTKLKFSLGIFTQNRDGFSSDGVKFIVMLDMEQKKQVIFAETMTELNNWKDIALDLSGYSGKKASIELITQPLMTWNYDWATWGSPRILNYSVTRDYDIKNAEFAEKHESIVSTYMDIALPKGANRVDKGWFAEAKVTDINLTEVGEGVVIRSEIYLVDKSEKLDEEIKVEVLGDEQELLSVGRYPISDETEVIVSEYRVDDLENKPKIMRISLDQNNPSLFFIKSPIEYSTSKVREKDLKDSVILISLDALRADHLGCYGYKRDVSPNIDAVASESFIFKNTFSNSNWTLPTHTSLFTSLYPSQHQIVLRTWDNGLFKGYEGPYFYVTEAFKSQNFITVAFTGGAYVHSRYGFNRGFDYHIEEIKQLDDKSLDLLIKVIEDSPKAPMFLFFHTYEIHDYYLEKPFHSQYVKGNFKRDEARLIDHITLQAKDIWNDPRYEIIRGKIMPPDGVEYIVDLYDSAIFYSDSLIGKFFGKLKDMGIYDESWIIITSDHGEGFGDIHDSNHFRSWSHGGSLHDSQIKIPLIIKPPKGLRDVFNGERKVNASVQTIDIAPSMLSIIGLNEREDFTGRSLFPLLVKGNRWEDRAVFSEELNTQMFAVIFEGYKLIRKPRSRMFADRTKTLLEMYNLEDDLGENVNLRGRQTAPKYFPVYNRLERVLDHHLGEFFSEGQSSLESVSESEERSNAVDLEQIKRLKELGYL